MNEKALTALQEYNEKVAKGEIERAPPKKPLQKWEEDKTSLRKSVSAQCFMCMGGLDGDNSKINRWLGYVQGVLITVGYLTVQGERDYTRKYFTAHRK